MAVTENRDIPCDISKCCVLSALVFSALIVPYSHNMWIPFEKLKDTVTLSSSEPIFVNYVKSDIRQVEGTLILF